MIRSRRRLYLAADKSTVVGEGDPRAAFLLVGAGCEMDDADAARLGVSTHRDLEAIIAEPEAPASDVPAEGDDDSNGDDPADDAPEGEDGPADPPRSIEFGPDSPAIKKARKPRA